MALQDSTGGAEVLAVLVLSLCFKWQLLSQLPTALGCDMSGCGYALRAVCVCI